MERATIELKRSIGLRFKEARIAISKTQKELAAMLGMNTSSIAGIEIGKAFPSIPIMLFLKENFDISPLWIMSGEGKMFVTGKLPGNRNRKPNVRDIYPGIPDNEKTRDLLSWMQDEFVLHHLVGTLMEMKVIRYPDYFKKVAEEKKEGKR